MLGSKVMGNEQISHGKAKKQRLFDEPIRSIKINYKIPQNLKDDLFNDLFDFGEKMKKVQLAGQVYRCAEDRD